MIVTLTLIWITGVRIELGKILDEYVSSYQR